MARRRKNKGRRRAGKSRFKGPGNEAQLMAEYGPSMRPAPVVVKWMTEAEIAAAEAASRRGRFGSGRR